MADNWISEITLQKVFSLSPGEAHCTVAARNGLKTSEIAELSNLSENTVRTLLNRGANKMKKNQKISKLVVVKGDSSVEGIGQKLNATKVLLKFAEKALGAKQVDGNSVLYLEGLDLTTPGDLGFMRDKVFRRADIYGTSSDKEADARAQRLMDAYLELDQGRNAFGIATLRYYLDEMQMKYDVIE